MDRLRIDKWLWAARFFKSRALAAKACQTGRIQVGGQPVKASREIRAGDWLKVKKGRAPVAEKLDAELARKLGSETDAIERQIQILEWSYERYHRFLPVGNVIKYEELIATRAGALARFFPTAVVLDEDLVSKNLNKHYDRSLMADIGRRLLKRGGALWHFYSKADVETLGREVTGEAPIES